MPNQVQTLILHEDMQTRMAKEKIGQLDNSSTLSSLYNRAADGARWPETIRGTRSDRVKFYTSDMWTGFYPNQEVVVVTSIGQPPIPPEGYLPLRHGHRRSVQNSSDGMSNGFSLDTLLWGEELLEQRIMQLTGWTRRSPLPRHQKLELINRMINQLNANEVN